MPIVIVVVQLQAACARMVTHMAMSLASLGEPETMESYDDQWGPSCVFVVENL